jgi:hypothetical protein
MNRIAAVVFALCAMFAPTALFAQTAAEPVPEATPANGFNDPAMSFVAPSDFHKVPMQQGDPTSFDKPTVVAAFVKNYGKPSLLTITITMENFEGSADGYDQVSENTMRNQADGVFIKKQPTKLANGMPAYWQEVTIGNGFGEIKRFQYVWADGVRGVQLAVTGRYGEISENDAKKILAEVSAVAFPRGRY